MGKRPLKAGRGYEFVKKGRNGIMLRRAGGGPGAVGTTFTCECDLTGGCKVIITGSEASCLNSGCSGACGWIVNVPGLIGFRVRAVAARKPNR
jgi:hypothetical protein